MSWARTRERGSLLGMRFVIACLRVFGVRAAGIVVEPIILYFFLTGRRARENSRRYLQRVWSTDEGRRALGRAPSLWTSWMHFRTFGHSLLDRAAFWCGLDHLYTINFGSHSELEQLRTSGRGALLLGAHLGSIDVLRALATRNDKPVNLVMFQANALKINALFRALVPEMEMRVIHVQPGSIQSVIDLKACIDRGELVAILGDRAELSSRRRIGRAKFMGVEAEFPLGPLWIAHILECPVYSIFALRGERRTYDVRFELLGERIALDPRRRELDLQAWLERYVRKLEAQCLRTPLQWFNFYDFWCEDAPDRIESQPASKERRSTDALAHGRTVRG